MRTAGREPPRSRSSGAELGELAIAAGRRRRATRRSPAACRDRARVGLGDERRRHRVLGCLPVHPAILSCPERLLRPPDMLVAPAATRAPRMLRGRRRRSWSYEVAETQAFAFAALTRRAAAKPASRSALRSSMFSRPTERRTRPGRDAGRELLLGGELRVRRRRGVDDEAAHVADVGEVAEQRHVVDEGTPGIDAALELEREHGADALGGVLVGGRVPRARRQSRVVDRGDIRVVLEPLGDLLGVLHVALDAQAEASRCPG